VMDLHTSNGVSDYIFFYQFYCFVKLLMLMEL